MAEKKIVAYIGTYTYDDSPGLFVYDVKKDGKFLSLREHYSVSNLSYLCLSKDGKNLYTIVDEGVAAFSIDENGDLFYMNTKPIGGMRGCFLDVDSQKRFLFVAGFHDGRVSMIKLKNDGSISGVAYGVFHQGHVLSANERRLDHPKVSCVRLTPDEEFLCAADYGLNQMKVYKVDYKNGTLELTDIVRCALDSPPRTIQFSPDGKYCYILTEVTNQIEVYKYSYKDGNMSFELVERSSLNIGKHVAAAPTYMTLTEDGKYVIVTLDGKNGVVWFKRSKSTGKLEYAAESLISGTYPKYAEMIPHTNEMMVLNHDSNTVNGFNMFFKDNYMLMCERPETIDRPNCVCFNVIE